MYIYFTSGTEFNKFEIIAGATSEKNPRLRPFGVYLFGNETTESIFAKNVFMLKFNNLTCIHERQYKCNLGVRPSEEFDEKQIESDIMQIYVTVKVRSPSIALLPNKTVFHEGDSIKLECKAFGNPNPSYTWIKGNRSNETIVVKDSFVIEHANISDSGFYTCDTSNSIDGKVYTEYLSTYIDIADRPTTPFSATLSPAGSDNTKVIVGVSVGGTVFLVILAGFIYKCMKRHMPKTNEKTGQNKETDNEFNQQQNETSMDEETGNRQIKDTDSEDNPQKDDTYADAQDGVYDKPGDRRHIEGKNCEHFDHVDTAKNIR
ncbi:unnamed protein product [Mytilus coruscus]|uniref:Ig-like domain-containing protein n=1 Tax=Mytilus coruscus TaxID=42192 RepID=A0A6J8EHA9_MYTCO|nr:unnamed protein product [Mytilus coruscus]